MKTLAALLLGALIFAQPVNAGPAYDETANAVMDLKRALETARDSGRRVLVVFGANWCPYCRSLAKALDAEAGRRLQQDFVVVKVDVGQFDKNMDLVEAYDDPLRSGLPGAAVVNADDKAVYTADADELINAVEEGDNGLYELLQDKAGQ
jgi:protein disulfide-isomerase